MLLWIKAVHVMAIISWMAGLLYLYRLFVYHAMETETVVMERFQVMERRLLSAITTPASIVSFLTGAYMLYLQPGYLTQPWMHVKLLFVLGLFAMTGIGRKFQRQLITEPKKVKHQTFRILNEIPTVLMIVIVVMIIVRPFAK